MNYLSHPVLFIRYITWHVVYFTINFSYGVWFLLRHPISFAKFAKEFRRFENKIDVQDEIADSGYYELNRRQRRAMARRVKRTQQFQDL